MKDHGVPCTEPHLDGAAACAGQGFGQFYKCPKFSDVTLVDAVGNRIAAHRLVLSAGSTKFDEMLSHDAASEIYCIDIEPTCLHAMLEFLYTSRCNIQIENAVQILSAAMLYGCDELESMTSLFIHMRLNSTTCCFFFAEAQKYKVEHIAIKALYVASLDYQNVIQSQSFYDLSLENLTAMLGSPKLGAFSKIALYKAGCSWIMKDSTRLEHFKDVLVCIQTRPSTATDELNLLRFLNATEGKTVFPSDLDMEWTSTTKSTMMSYDSKSSGGGLSDAGLRHSRLASSGISPHPFCKDLKTSAAKGVAASRMASALCGSFFADNHLQKTEPQTMSVDAAESAKARSVEDNVSSETSSVRKPKTKRGRGRKGAGKPGQPFTCQVEGCTANLQGLKQYHIRYRICDHHLKVTSIVKDGQHQRFCQQCGRFHLLDEFDNNKRSCRARLRRHNQRRRKGQNSAAPKQNGFLSMPSVTFPPQHLVYLSAAREADKLYDARSRCLQILSPSEMNPCVMFSTVPRSTERDPNFESVQSGNDTTANCRTSFAKADPGSGRKI